MAASPSADETTGAGTDAAGALVATGTASIDKVVIGAAGGAGGGGAGRDGAMDADVESDADEREVPAVAGGRYEESARTAGTGGVGTAARLMTGRGIGVADASSVSCSGTSAVCDQSRTTGEGLCTDGASRVNARKSRAVTIVVTGAGRRMRDPSATAAIAKPAATAAVLHTHPNETERRAGGASSFC